MKSTTIDNLNKILTNTIEFQEVLKDLAKSVYDETTKEKLKELAAIKKKHSEQLIGLISDLGGDVESTGRMTDQEAVSWVQKPLPAGDEMTEILSLLKTAEEKALNDYNELLAQSELNDEMQQTLEVHVQDVKANLKYFTVAKESLEKR